MTKRYLVLENGQVFVGDAIGADADVTGELVFSTGMTGYQDSITDQSYNGQILTFTYPLIGNYGINRDDYESINPTTKAVVVHEVTRRPSNWRQQMSLDEFLQMKGIPGIANVDTRALTKLIRDGGAMKASLVSSESQLNEIKGKIGTLNLPTNQIATSSTPVTYISPNVGRKIVLVDFGLKHSIIRELAKRGCSVTVVPYNTTAAEILQLAPDGVMLSNGPGNPVDVPAVLEMIRGVQTQVPLFVICMGHQLFCLANGASTYKMKFGHRGFNHAVRNLQTGRIDFTSQNHGFAVAQDDLPANLTITHVEINDGSVEGVRHTQYPAFSVQFHPDAAPGPHDANYLFDEFMNLIDEFKK